MTASASLRDRACIVGIGSTEYRPRGGHADRTPLSLACEAVLAALDDAGLTPDELDGFSGYSSEAVEGGSMLASALGVPQVRYSGMVWGGGGAGLCGAFTNAAMAVATGVARAVVVYRVVAQGKVRFGQALAQPGISLGGEAGLVVPFGLLAPAQMFALSARRHMHLYGTRPEHYAEVAIATRAHAVRNPEARFRSPLMLDDYFAARMIASPLRLYDCCLESDGAAAAVLVSVERARDLRRRPVFVMGAVHGGGFRWGQGFLSSHSMPDEAYASAGQREVARDLYATACAGPGDVDVALIYDHFTPMVLQGLEDFGFCAVGEGGPFVEGGALRWPDGALPTNTHGGNLSHAYIHGMTHVLEAVRQLRGTAVNQVPDARVALVAAGAGPLPTGGMLLRR
jgi:acetyl-CoA acetyltransferase